LPNVHFARLLIVDDPTTGDVAEFGVAPRTYPPTLAFLGDVDGDADAFLADAAREAPDGLRALFSCCEGFDPGADLLAWMRRHSVRPAAAYANWRGRTVRRIREEAALGETLARLVRGHAAELRGRTAAEMHDRLRRAVRAEVDAGRLVLSPEAPTPFG